MEQESVSQPLQAPLPRANTSPRILRIFLILITQFFTIYVLLAGSLFVEIWWGIFLPNKLEFDVRYLFVILSHSASALLPVFLIYTAARRGIVTQLEKLMRSKHILGDSVRDILFDIFVIIAGILMYAPVRAVLQDKRVINSFTITEVFVRYDFIPTVIILSVLAVIPITTILIQQNSVVRYVKVGLILLTIMLAGIVNSPPNFDARIFEARAAWKSSPPTVLIEKARIALIAAKTNEQRAIAYYWIGVGYNLSEDPTKAIFYQKKAILEDPNFGAAHSSLAYAYLRLSQPEEARKAADECVKVSPEYAWCYMAMGEYFFYINDFKSGYQMFKKARSISPDSPEIVDGMDNVTKYMRENNIIIE